MEPDVDLLEFSAARNKGHGLTPIPSPLDEQIGLVVKGILDGSLDLKDVRYRLPSDADDTLMGYAERMASLTVRTRDEGFVLLALCALALIEEPRDVRDLILVIAVIYDAARRVAAPLSIVAKLRMCEGTPGLEQWVAFTNRCESARILSVFGYELSNDADGVRYRRNW